MASTPRPAAAGAATKRLKTRILRVLSSYPVTSILLIVITLIAVLHGTFIHSLHPELLATWGFSLRDLPAESYSLLTAPFFVLHPSTIPSTVLLVLIAVGAAERRLGVKRTLIAFGTGHVLGYVVAPALAWLLSRAGLHAFEAIVAQSDVGASNGAFGAAGAVIATLPGATGTVVFILMSTFLGAALALDLQVWNIAHMIAFGAGIALGGLIVRSLGRSWPQLTIGTSIERRHRPHVIAALVWIIGLVNVFSSIVLVHSTRLDAVRRALPFDNPHWPRHAFFVIGILLMILSRGLGRAQRRTWWLALSLLVVTSLLNVTLEPFHPQAIISIGVALLFVVWRQAFTARTIMERDVGRVATIAAAGVVAFLVVGFVGLRSGFEPPATPVSSARELYTQLTFSSTHVLEPTTERTRWFIELLPFALFGALGIVFAAIVRNAGPPPPSPGDEQVAKRILASYNTSGTTFMTLWSGNSLFVSADRRTYVAYRVASDVAVALGEPVGPPECVETSAAEFRSFCAGRGWDHVFYAVTDAASPGLARAGYELLQIGEEAVIPLEDLAFKGKEWQPMRSAFNRAKREGVVFRIYEGGTVPADVRTQMDEIYAEVGAARSLPPMEFTLGKPSDVEDRNVSVGVATDANGRVHGYVDWLPISARRGWVIDLMMRRSDCMSNVMEFLIGSSFLAFQDRGYAFASLAAAPLADIDREPTKGSLVQRTIALIYDRFDAYYNFRSLFEYKAKFQPKWKPVYLAYEGVDQLPRVAAAIVGAHLPGLDPLLVAELLGASLWHRISGAFEGDRNGAEPARTGEAPSQTTTPSTLSEGNAPPDTTA